MVFCNFCRKHVQGANFINAPRCVARRTLWEQILECTLTENSRICDTHFSASQWKSLTNKGKTLKRRRLNNDAVPEKTAEPAPAMPKLTYAESSSQTEDQIINLENESLKKRILLMEKEVVTLRQQLDDYRELEMSLRKIFTETQIKILKNGGKRANFNSTDMSSAICLHSAGPRAYNHLYRKGFPLPSRATLYRWLAEVQIKTGTLDVVLDLMENEDMQEVDRLCVLSFDEMKVTASFEYDSSADVVYEPSNYVQLAIVRGLIKSWKQPIYFDYDTRMDADTLRNIIRKLHQKGYPVVAIVSDLGPGNQRLWRELGISETKAWFCHPADEHLRIYVFSDTPHLIKLIRNHYIDTGLIVNGIKLTKTTVQQTIRHCSQSDISILFKITENHVNVCSLAKQKVKLATQLFSNTTASSIRRCFTLGYAVDNACETAELFKLFNDWFDVFNSKLSTSNCIEATQPYGKQIEIQRGILAKMSDIMRSDVVGKARRLPFQKGIIVNNLSLDGLFGYLSEMYNIHYILTSRLNQDIVENFFGAMRSRGGQYDHPSPLEFKYRLRKYITAKNTEILSGNGNVNEDNSDNWLNLDYSHTTTDDNNNLDNNDMEIDIDNTTAITPADYDFDELTEDALEYLAGYVIQKLGLKNELAEIGTFTYVDEVSHGGFTKPSNQFMEKIKQLEVVFLHLAKNDFNITKHVKQTLIRAAEEVQVSIAIKTFYFKTRIYFRVKNLNKRLAIQKQKQRIFGNSKLLQIKL